MEEKQKQEQKQKPTLKKPKYRLKEVKSLGHDLLSSKTHINNLPILLSFISPCFPPQLILESLLSLHSFFAPLLPSLPPSSSVVDDNEDDAQRIYNTWIRSKFDEFIRSLIQLVTSPQIDVTLAEVALDTLLEFVKIGNGGKFNSSIYHKLVHTIVHATTPLDSILLHVLTSKYFKYIDIRYFTFISLEKLARMLEANDISNKSTDGANQDDDNQSGESMEFSIRQIHYLMSHIPPLLDFKENSHYEIWGDSGFSAKDGNCKGLSEVPETEDEQLKTEKNSRKILSATKISKKMRLKFTKAWISFLRLPLPVEVYKEVLATLHQSIIPYLSNPVILCDFLTRSYDIGGVVSVMALNSLFILMTEHCLEYPNFYEKLYALLLPSIFMAKHRTRFFQLLDLCLKSPLLPAYLAAAFAKKLSRLAITVPPSGALVIIALIHNLLRRHPSVNCLVHREDFDVSTDRSAAERHNVECVRDSGDGSNNLEGKFGTDHFDNDEKNPMKSNALRSSLWEIDTLRHHYCPPVSRFVLLLENDLTVRAKTTEVNITDFASGSYATIFGNELRRRVKQVPLAFYKATPTSLFSASDFTGWTFRNEEGKENNIINGTLNMSKENDQGSVKRQRIESS